MGVNTSQIPQGIESLKVRPGVCLISSMRCPLPVFRCVHVRVRACPRVRVRACLRALILGVEIDGQVRRT